MPWTDCFFSIWSGVEAWGPAGVGAIGFACSVHHGVLVPVGSPYVKEFGIAQDFCCATTTPTATATVTAIATTASAATASAATCYHC